VQNIEIDFYSSGVGTGGAGGAAAPPIFLMHFLLSHVVG
jgi:hypothetical protein